MREGWEYRKLGEVCMKITDGSHNPPKGIEHSEYRMISSQNIFDDEIRINSDNVRYLTEKDFVIEDKRTALCAGMVLLTIVGTIGRACVISGNEGKIVLQRSVAALSAKDKVLPRYLMYCLIGKRDELNIESHGIAQKGIYLKQLSSLQIPLPPLTIQQSIVAELDEINNLLSLKRKELETYDKLAQSLFYEMFGDPVENEKGWEVKKLERVCISKLKYGSGASAKEYDGIIRYVRITDINDDGTLNDDIKSPSSIEDDYILQKGDILFARSGATVGKTYLHSNTENKCLYAGYLIRARIDSSIVLPLYVFHFTKSHAYKSWIALNARAVAQPNINAKQYGELQIPLPPLPLQQLFATRIEAIEKQKANVKTAIEKLETLLAARMQYWFE